MVALKSSVGAPMVSTLDSFSYSFDKHLSSTNNIPGAVLLAIG